MSPCMWPTRTRVWTPGTISIHYVRERGPKMTEQEYVTLQEGDDAAWLVIYFGQERNIFRRNT